MEIKKLGMNIRLHNFPMLPAAEGAPNSTGESERIVCQECLGLGGRASGYGPPLVRLPDGRLSGWIVGGKKDCVKCGGTGFENDTRLSPATRDGVAEDNGLLSTAIHKVIDECNAEPEADARKRAERVVKRWGEGLPRSPAATPIWESQIGLANIERLIDIIAAEFAPVAPDVRERIYEAPDPHPGYDCGNTCVIHRPTPQDGETKERK